MRITVFTTAYNGYGRFIPRWLKSVQAQIYKPHEIIVVLGYKHDFKGDFPDNVRVINCDLVETMGYLRNLAIDAATGDYLFYFSADDILLGNALDEIRRIDADIIALRYYKDCTECVTPEIIADKLINWRENYVGASGYVAFKRGLRYDDTDWPNYPLLFKAYLHGYTFKTTQEPGAVYIKRPTGHGQIPENNKQGLVEIRKYLLLYKLIK